VDNEGPRSAIAQPPFRAENRYGEQLLTYFRIAAALALCATAACSHATTGSQVASGGKTIGVSIQNREAQFYQDMEGGKIRLQSRRRRREPRQRQAAEPS
jgi:hypothetical protein